MKMCELIKVLKCVDGAREGICGKVAYGRTVELCYFKYSAGTGMMSHCKGRAYCPQERILV